VKNILRLNNGRIWKRKINAAMTLRKIINRQKFRWKLTNNSETPNSHKNLRIMNCQTLIHHHERQNLISMYIIPPALCHQLPPNFPLHIAALLIPQANYSPAPEVPL
jgi:hypothetical protein